MGSHARAGDMIISTARLIIRPLQRADLDALAAWPQFTDPLDQSWNWAQQAQANGTTDLLFFTHATNRTRHEWAITRVDQVIGYLGIRTINEGERSARLGIGLAAPFVGQGYGLEALRGFGDAYFGALNFDRLLLDVHAHNTRALRLYERLGFQIVRTFWQPTGSPHDFQFLAAPQYATIREHFRQEDQQMLVRCVAMLLTADAWRTSTGS